MLRINESILIVCRESSKSVCRMPLTAISRVNNFSGPHASWPGTANTSLGRRISERNGTYSSLWKQFMMIFVWRVVAGNFLRPERSRAICVRPAELGRPFCLHAEEYLRCYMYIYISREQDVLLLCNMIYVTRNKISSYVLSCI